MIDPSTNTIYYQAHTQDEYHTAGIYALQYTQNRVSKKWYAVTWPSTTPMQFGYMGYQYLSVAK